MTPNLKLQEAIKIVNQEYELHYNCYPAEKMTKGYIKIRNAMKDVISAAQSILDKGEAKQMTVEDLMSIIHKQNLGEVSDNLVICNNLATALFEAVYGGKDEIL